MIFDPQIPSVSKGSGATKAHYQAAVSDDTWVAGVQQRFWRQVPAKIKNTKQKNPCIL